MRGVRLYVVLLAVVAGISPMAAREIFAQSAPSSAPSPQAQPGATADASVQNLTAIVQQLANQVQKLSAQLDDVRDQEQEAREEARELRKELDDAHRSPARPPTHLLHILRLPLKLPPPRPPLRPRRHSRFLGTERKLRALPLTGRRLRTMLRKGPKSSLRLRTARTKPSGLKKTSSSPARKLRNKVRPKWKAVQSTGCGFRGSFS